MQLNELKDNKGARHRKMRIGRGIGSGKGKTGGRGGKGQTARTGVAIKNFEGGQTPLHRRLPKRGFNNLSRVEYPVVNIGGIQKAIDEKRLDAKKTVDLDALKAAGLLRQNETTVKLLGKGNIKVGVQLEVTLASKAAVESVEKAGGKVTVAENATA